ncbi:MAG: hypothetical protein LBM02_06940 [Lachnospiraceae bacterium]|jgi:hypothetical protein|nr:hypothetical protein [Lachnospiraceae bacterium]
MFDLGDIGIGIWIVSTITFFATLIISAFINKEQKKYKVFTIIYKITGVVALYLTSIPVQFIILMYVGGFFGIDGM